MRWLMIILVAICVISCKEESIPTPKPRMFPRIVFPDRVLEKFTTDYCEFTFDKPGFAKVVRKELFFDEKPPSDCWFDLEIKELGASIHCSYYPVNNREHFDELVQDAFKITGKHNIKADYIDELVIRNSKGAGGIMFELSGPVASPVQFFLTDTTSHFLRGSLYFNSTVDRDSIKPVYEFLMTDVGKMLETFDWN